ncbi:hypothetical protein [Aliarcobacter butzleri]|nr:hypothetical protein [Aliarcobacter butzleri]
MSANFKDGMIRKGNFVGAGKTLGNIKEGIVRDGIIIGTGKTYNATKY